MTRRMLVVFFALAMCGAAQADVTIKATGTGKGLGMSGTMPSTTYIKGLKMRVESVLGKKATTTIFDVENQKMVVLDDKKKEADVWDMATLSAELSKAVAPEGARSSIKPNGQTKTIAGQPASGHDIEIVVPATVGGAGGIAITVLLNGVAWIVKDAPGAAEYAAFYQSAVDKGWIFSDPRAAKGSPGQAKAMAAMYAEFAKLGGVPYESQFDIKLQGEGMFGGLTSKLGGLTMTTITDTVETGPLADELFQPPADYTLNPQQ